MISKYIYEHPWMLKVYYMALSSTNGILHRILLFNMESKKLEKVKENHDRREI